MPAQTIARRTRQARHIAEGALHFAPLVAENLRRALGCDLDWENTQRRLAEELLEAADALHVADEACSRERHAAIVLREKRDEATRTLYRHVVGLRQVVTATHGERTMLRLLGLEGKTPRQGDRLASAARRMVKRLRRPDRGVRTGLAQVLEGLYVAAGMPEMVPGLRRPGASALHPVRKRATGRKTARHPVPETVETGPEAQPTVPEEEVARDETAPPVPATAATRPAPLRLVPGPQPPTEADPHRSSDRSTREPAPPVSAEEAPTPPRKERLPLAG
jgi:hypothetical protein